MVMACTLGGFMLHHGQLMTLFVPTEYLIIGGCLVGGMIVRNDVSTLIGLIKDFFGLLAGAGVKKKHYVELLRMLYELFQLSRREGLLALETHASEPKESSIFQRYPSFLKNHTAVHYLCDSLKLFAAGVLDPHNMDELMERDLEIIKHHALKPSGALSNGADSLPAIGIVAAVLGIILTMGSIDQGAVAVGQKVAGALVGTFLGVFLAYGFVAPIAGALAEVVEGKVRYIECMRHVLSAVVAGVTPAMAVEVGRRTIDEHARPSFEELEKALREKAE